MGTGTFSVVGAAGSARGPAGVLSIADVDGMTFDPHNGYLLGVARRAGGTDVLVRLDPGSGRVYPDHFGPGMDYLVLSGEVGTHVDDLAIDPLDGSLVAVVASGSFPSSLVLIDRTSGGASRIVTLNSDDAEGLTFDGDGSLIATIGRLGRRIVDIDRTTGRPDV